jgi:hypothetical protein
MQGLVGKPEEKRPLRRHMRRLKANKKVDLKDVRRGFMNWTDLTEDSGKWRALVNTAMILRFAQTKRNFLTR